MSKKKEKKPDPKGGMIRRNFEREVLFLRFPKDLKAAMDRAAKFETRTRRHSVNLNEFVTRAVIDRLGEIYGIQVAKQFYRKYFNGLAPLEFDVKLPDIGTNEQNLQPQD